MLTRDELTVLRQHLELYIETLSAETDDYDDLGQIHSKIDAELERPAVELSLAVALAGLENAAARLRPRVAAQRFSDAA